MQSKQKFTDINLDESLNQKFCHAVHCALYTTSECSEGDSFGNSYCLMQMRSDGLIGFPGGFVDEEVNGLDDIIIALKRELKEEINSEEHIINREDYVFSSLTETNDGRKIVLHFFVKQLNKDAFENIEKNAFKAIHFLKESLGLFRVPMKNNQKFLENFLQASIFCGNSKAQLIKSIEYLNQKNKL